jgi:hypothetical protein
MRGALGRRHAEQVHGALDHDAKECVARIPQPAQALREFRRVRSELRSDALRFFTHLIGIHSIYQDRHPRRLPAQEIQRREKKTRLAECKNRFMEWSG